VRERSSALLVTRYENPMTDLVFIALTVALLALSFGLVRLCASV
jgi:hypothetical protein